MLISESFHSEILAPEALVLVLIEALDRRGCGDAMALGAVRFSDQMRLAVWSICIDCLFSY